MLGGLWFRGAPSATVACS
ncbi:BnaC04g51370D [Brassica napus]|uniref:BnaC04g51370D protein n=1 Tax=Brassica napus TaxID=3708 RepID=A0A078GQB1_BRANA|nr:BnaC04g51370D [Brassica napus]